VHATWISDSRTYQPGVLDLIRLENKGITVRKADGQVRANRKKGGRNSTAGVDGYEGHCMCGVMLVKNAN
jgi:hypothetical protein